MIPDKIQDLFKFIDFLDDNKETFYKYNTNFDNAIKLRSQKSKLKPKEKFADRVDAKRLQKEKNEEFDKVFKNVTQPITDKITDLGFKVQNHFWNFGDETGLQNKATCEDLTIINSQLSKYFKFREDGRAYFCDRLFSDLDKFLTGLADYFGQEYPDELKEKILSVQVEPQQYPEAKAQTEFESFFNLEKVSDEFIKAIKEEFKHANGKRMAMLIYELTKLDLIHIIERSRQKSRKHFCQSLNRNIKRTSGINKFLLSSDLGLKLKDLAETDDEYKMVSRTVKDILREVV